MENPLATTWCFPATQVKQLHCGNCPAGSGGKVVGCVLCSLSKVEELFFSFANRNRTVPSESQDKEI